MPPLLSSGNHIGIVESDAILILPAWSGEMVQMDVNIPLNQNTADRSFTFEIEVADAEAGPWTFYAGFGWTGGNIGKDGTWSPAMRWPIHPDTVGQWMRGTFDIPVRMRFSLDIALSL